MNTEHFDQETSGPIIAQRRIKPLMTKGLILHPAIIDMPDYSHWLNDPEVVKYSELRHRHHTHESCKEYARSFDQMNNFMWNISMVGANMHIGNITAHIDPHNNVAQMGMLIGEKWAWGRRFGQEAWKSVMTFLQELPVRKIEAGCMNANTGMMKVAERCGMEHESNVKNHFLLDGTPITKRLYGKIF